MKLRHFLACSLTLLIVASTAWAGRAVDIKAKNGTHWRGEIGEQVVVKYTEQRVDIELTGKLVDVTEYTITVEGEIAGQVKQKTIYRGDIVDMSDPAEEPAATGKDDATSGRPRLATTGRKGVDDKVSHVDPDKPGVFFLPLTGMVGLELRHEEMEAIAKEADKWGPGQIIVLEIQSGGGAVTEMEKIHETLTEIKKRHRLVAWIKEAISAACATAIHCDEIYFTTEGTAGSMTAFNGATGVSWKGDDLQRWMNTATEWMEAGGRYGGIGPAMIHAPLSLSYDKDEETGKVTWHSDLSGKYILSRPGENLTFNSTNAVHCGFADGVADTTDELAKLLDLPEWNEKSTYGREIHEDWIETVERAQKEIKILARRINYKNTGSGDPNQVLGYRASVIRQLIQWWDRAPNVCMMNGIPPKEDLERQLDEIKRMIAQNKKYR